MNEERRHSGSELRNGRCLAWECSVGTVTCQIVITNFTNADTNCTNALIAKVSRPRRDGGRGGSYQRSAISQEASSLTSAVRKARTGEGIGRCWGLRVVGEMGSTTSL